MLDIRATVVDFLANPFDPNNDGKTSLVEWVAFIGLTLAAIVGWKIVLNRIFGPGAAN